MSDSEDDDRPTPRLTGRFSFWQDASQKCAEEFYAYELSVSKSLHSYDRPRAEMARTAARLAVCYVQAFGKWATEDVPLERKQQDQDQFQALAKFAMVFFGRAKP